MGTGGRGHLSDFLNISFSYVTAIWTVTVKEDLEITEYGV